MATGIVPARPRAHVSFMVPPLQPGSYALTYWCRNCTERGVGVGLDSRSKLWIEAPVAETCPATTPNNRVPPGAGDLARSWTFHGNGALWAFLSLSPDGTLITNSLGGYKLGWLAKSAAGPPKVTYGTYGDSSAPLTARTGVLGSGNSALPSAMSQMSFSPGCWVISGRMLDVTLSFVVKVARGTG